MTNANPSLDPADNDSLTGAFRTVFKKLMQGVQNMLPATVVSIAAGQRAIATVQPMIMVLGTNGDRSPRAPVASIPIVTMGGGDFLISFPVRVGDLGFIKANDRDISLFTQSLKETRPNTNRMFNFADGVFIPARLAQWVLDEEDEDSLVIQSADGTVKIALSPTEITIKAPDGVTIDSDVTITKTLTVTEGLAANGGMTTTGGGGNSFVVTGNVRVVGDIAATGDITAHVPP